MNRFLFALASPAPEIRQSKQEVEHRSSKENTYTEKIKEHAVYDIVSI